ncbi:MAG TPA: HAD family acid phosphatase [Thermoanaerobaculia bacterium]
MNRILLPLLLTLSISCATAPVAPPPAVATAMPQCTPGHSILNATLWAQHSAEYRAIAMQTYVTASRALDAALADPSWTGAVETTADPSRPPAVILDLDETAIDNTPFQTRVIRRGMTFDLPMWKEWTAEGRAPAIPGAAEFLAYAKSRGVTPFYISNRDQDEMPGTRRNLEALGFPLSSEFETILLRGGRPEWVSDKASRRAHVAATHRILLMIGDDLNDFANAREAGAADREKIIREHASWWGTRWFMLPNAMYGSWERAAIGRNGEPCEQVQKKIDLLH